MEKYLKEAFKSLEELDVKIEPIKKLHEAEEEVEEPVL